MKPLVFVLLIAIIVVFRNELGNPFNRPSGDYSHIQTGDVVMYSTAWCPYCKQARSLLEEAGVVFTEYDIEKSTLGHQQYQALGGSGVPVLVINGEVVRGYDPNRIVALLEAGRPLSPAP